MAKFAAALLEAHEDDIVFENGTDRREGRAGVRASRSPRSRRYAYVPVPLPAGLEPGLSEEAFFEPANNTYPFGCHISMLEIDRETGEPTLLKLVAVDDAGHLINPLIVEGQIHGGLAQGIGQAMIEEAVYNDDGQLVTGSFMDYAMPRATDFPRFELARHGHADAGEPARRQGRRRSRHARLDAVHRQRGGGRARRVRREAHRHDAAAREAVAHHPGRPGMIPTAFEYARATSLDDALAKLQAASGDGKLIAGGHSLVPLMKLRLSEPQRADRHQPHPGPGRHSRARRQDRDRRRHRAPRRRDVGAAARAVPGGRRGRRRRSAIRRCATAARSAAAWRTRIRRPTMPAVMLALDAEIHLKGPQGWRVGEGAATSSRTCSRWTWRPTRSSSACSSRRCGPRPTPSSTSARRTTRSSASPRRSR